MEPRKVFLGMSVALAVLCGLTAILVWVLWTSTSPSVQPPGEKVARAGAGNEGRGDASAKPETPDSSEGGAPEPETRAPPADPADALPVSIEGKVTEAGGKGVPGARVVVQERRAWMGAMEKGREELWENPLKTIRAFQESYASLAASMPSTRTGEDGTYKLRGLPEGEHRVIVTHGDFLPHQNDDWVFVEAGKTARYDVELVPGLRITGRVLDAAGKPVPLARVKATPSEVAHLMGIGKIAQTVLDQGEGKILIDSGRAETDAAGAFRLTSLEPGLHDVEVRKDGFAWNRARNVPAGTEGILISLEPGIRVKGRVVAPGRKPVPGAEVVLREPERDSNVMRSPLALALADLDLLGEKERRARSDDEGLFQMDSFQRGVYELVIRAEEYPLHKSSVKLEGKSVDLGEVVLAAGRAIAGRVVGPEGSPVEGARVWVPKPGGGGRGRVSRRFEVLQMGPSSSIAQALPDRQGSFRLAGLEAGACELAASAPGFPAEYLESVALGAGEVTIRLRNGLVIPGRVIDAESGAPIAGAKVSSSRRDGEAVTSADGRFELRGLSREETEIFGNRIFLRAGGEGYQDARETVTLPADIGQRILEPVEFKLKRSEVRPGLSGNVLDPQGAPVADACVWFEIPGFPRTITGLLHHEVTQEVRTDEDGSFSFADFWMGQDMSLEVVASHPGFAKGRSGPIARPGEGGWPSVEIRLSPGTAIEGRVTGSDGLAVSGARLRAWRDVTITGQAFFFSQMIPRGAGETTYSSSDGSYRLGRLEPGTYRVEARGPGYAAKALGPLQVGDPPATLDFVLDAGGTLKGRVVDLEQSPMAAIEVVAFLNVETTLERRPQREDEEILELEGLGAASAKTDAAGVFELTHLSEGEFRVVARARGFDPAEIPSAAPGQALPDLVLVRLSRIDGRVADGATAAPISGFFVRLGLKSPDGEGEYHEDYRFYREVDDASGRFSYDSLKSGDYRVRVMARDHAPWSKQVRIEAGQDLEIEVALNPGTRVEGLVRTRDGGPLSGVRVFARRTGGQLNLPREYLEPAMSGADGRFLLTGVDVGEYEVSIHHPYWRAEDGKDRLSFQVPFAVTPALEFVMGPAGRLEGRIGNLPFADGENEWHNIGLTGVPERSQGVSRAPEEISTWIQGDGKFQAEGLNPGKYKVELQKYRRPTGDEKGEAQLVEKQPLGEVEVRAGETAKFEASVP